MKSKDILTRVFDITRDPRDGLLFLQEFKSISPESFALLFADADTILESAGVLFSDIKLLQRLDLFPVVTLEDKSFQYLKVFFNPLDENTTGQGIGFPYSIITYSENLKSDIKNAIDSKNIPILLWKEDEISFQEFLSNTVILLNTNKVIITHYEGPIVDKNDKIVSLISTGEKLINYRLILNESERDLHFLEIAESLVKKRNDPKFSVVLTSPYTLLRELFTVKGSGTLVKIENKIRKLHSKNDIDELRLFSLIESSFSKRAKLNFRESKFSVLYLEENYQGCAWLNQTDLGFLLSKFAVNEIARGAGVGRDIWELITKENLPLFWRSKPNNNINKWYMKMAQGIEKDEQWYYYWLGVKTENIPPIIQYLRKQPEDFEVKV